MTNYGIGDKVITAEGIVGEIRDVLYSSARNTNLILIKPEDGSKVITREEREVELYEEPAKYTAEIEYKSDYVVTATVYKVTSNGKTAISVGNGKLRGDTAEDFAQAAGFALKVAYLKLKDGRTDE